VREAVDYREPVEPGVLCDDGYFRDATDIEGFAQAWDRWKPDPDSVVGSVYLDSSEDDYEFWTVYATGGKDEEGFDSPVVEWVSIFERGKPTGEWIGDSFIHVGE